MPFRLLQLTDLHLFGDPGGQLLGITTRRSFEYTLARALSGPAAVDALVLTGDLVHDESAAGYRYLRDTLKATDLAHYCIGGNHDTAPLMRTHLGVTEPVALRRLGDWNLILLDSSYPGCDGGHLTAQQLRQLTALLNDDGTPALIALHHHPVAIGSDWIDAIGVGNGSELLEVCRRHPQVKAVLFGHVHQETCARHGDCLLLATPATCFQFKPGSRDFALDDISPGYRELLLYPDGQLTTRVIRIEHYAERPLRQAQGY